MRSRWRAASGAFVMVVASGKGGGRPRQGPPSYPSELASPNIVDHPDRAPRIRRRNVAAEIAPCHCDKRELVSFHQLPTLQGRCTVLSHNEFPCVHKEANARVACQAIEIPGVVEIGSNVLRNYDAESVKRGNRAL